MNLFFSLDCLVIKDQTLNTKYQPKFLLSLSQLVKLTAWLLLLFKLKGRLKTLASNLVFEMGHALMVMSMVWILLEESGGLEESGKLGLPCQLAHVQPAST